MRSRMFGRGARAAALALAVAMLGGPAAAHGQFGQGPTPGPGGPMMGWGQQGQTPMMGPMMGWGQQGQMPMMGPMMGWGQQGQMPMMGPMMGWGQQGQMPMMGPMTGWGQQGQMPMMGWGQQGQMPMMGPMTGGSGMARFALVDRNADGFVSDDEAASQQEQVFDELDADGDEQLSKDEFAVVGPMGPGGQQMPMHRRWEARFTAMDKDKDGKVTLDDWAAFHAERYKASDLNGDGKVTVWEFRVGRRR